VSTAKNPITEKYTENTRNIRPPNTSSKQAPQILLSPQSSANYIASPASKSRSNALTHQVHTNHKSHSIVLHHHKRHKLIIDIAYISLADKSLNIPSIPRPTRTTAMPLGEEKEREREKGSSNSTRKLAIGEVRNKQ
jgi:hypothetical protein